jgi:hypothetical protein
MKGTNRRQYFTESELNKLISAARKGRYGHRDATLIRFAPYTRLMSAFGTKRTFLD